MRPWCSEFLATLMALWLSIARADGRDSVKPNLWSTWRIQATSLPVSKAATYSASVMEITLAPSSRPLIHTPIVATPAYLASRLLATPLSFSLVTCHRHSSYLAPCATSTHYRATSHRHDSSSATLSSALYIQPMYLLYLVRFELVGHTPLCTSQLPSL